MADAPRFPLLRTAEIVECLRELMIPVQEGDIKRPVPETVRPVYARFLELLLGVRPEDLAAPAFNAMKLLSFQELHESSLPEVAFLRSVTEMMHVSDVPDFRLSDLYEPDAKRTRRNLSALINFAKYREQRVVTYQELAEASQSKVQQRDALSKSTEQLSDKLNAARRKRKSEKAETDRLNAESDELQAGINEMQRRRTVLEEQNASLKTRKSGLDRTKTDLSKQLVDVNEACRQLSQQIVENPDALKAELVELAAQVESEKASKAAAEAKQRHLTKRLDMLALAEKSLNRVHDMMRAAQHESTRLAKAQASVKQLRGKENSLDEAVHELNVQVEQVRRQSKAAHERLARTTNSGKLRIQEAEQTLDALRSDRLTMEKQRATYESRIEANQAAMARLRRDMDDITTDHADAMRGLNDEYTQLKENLEQYHVAIFSSMV